MTIAISIIIILVFIGFFLFLRLGTQWGSTPKERAMEMLGDAYFNGDSSSRTVMTRAITISADPKDVWPWLAQLGRGAGWYSIDWLDNGRKSSAHHIISWIPKPELGDASAIGYLRYIEEGKELVWWTKEVKFAGATSRLVTDILLVPQEKRSRLIIRMSADAAGLTAPVAMLLFQFIDSIMAIRQLLGIKERIETRHTYLDNPETGAKDQYQLYESIFASGECVGVIGKEQAVHWRQIAIEDGVLLKDVSRRNNED